MYYRIYKRSLAVFLIDNGCQLIKTTPDIIDDTKLNWIFEDTPLLHKLMTLYTKKLRA